LRRRKIEDQDAYHAELHRYFGVTDEYAAWQSAPEDSIERTERKTA